MPHKHTETFSYSKSHFKTKKAALEHLITELKTWKLPWEIVKQGYEGPFDRMGYRVYYTVERTNSESQWT